MTVEDELTVRARTRVGTVLDGKYRLDRVLGVGGMASVYEATHRNSKRFAVKMLHPELSLRTDIRTRFLREGYVANQVQHPGAVAVHDDDIAEDGSAFIVMELLVGTTVEELWEKHRHRLPLAAVLAIAHQLLDVLAAAHERGIVHRDIKPANLFLTTEGQIKVLDFGIARLKDVANSSATSTGMVMGTPAFMSPEQALGKPSAIDGQSDLWAVGAVIFTLASGRFIHEGESAQHIVVQAATTPAPSFATVMPDASKEVVQLVDSALAFDKSARWPTAKVMQKGLAAAIHATFGDGLSRRGLADLLSGKPPSGFGPTEASRPPPVRTAPITTPIVSPSTESPVSSENEPTRIHTMESRETPPAHVMTQPSRRHIGLTTAQPVSSEPAGVPSRGNRRVWIGAGGLGLVALVATGVMLRAGGDHGAATSPSDAASVPSVLVPTMPAPVASAKPVEPPSVVFDDLPRAPQSVRPQVPTPTAAPQASALAAAPVPSVPSTPQAATAPGKPNCSPPYTVDPVTQKKHFKVECL